MVTMRGMTKMGVRTRIRMVIMMKVMMAMNIQAEGTSIEDKAEKIAKEVATSRPSTGLTSIEDKAIVGPSVVTFSFGTHQTLSRHSQASDFNF